MKKLKLLIIILAFPILLCSCKKEETQLIELTSEELVYNLKKEGTDIIFAVINSNENDTEKFLTDLENLTKSVKTNIYYIDFMYLDEPSVNFLLYESYETDFTTNSLHVIENNELTISIEYTNFKDAYVLIKDKIFKHKIEQFTKEKKQQYLEQAKKLYEENKFSESYEYICKSWNLKEAKEYYEENKYFQLINIWEHFIITNEEPKTIYYQTLAFYANTNILYRLKETALYETYKKPTDLGSFENLYYKVEDDIIYTAVSKNSDYKPTYEITSIDNVYLKVIDLENNKEYFFTKRID